jgi:hypothetical protein
MGLFAASFGFVNPAFSDDLIVRNAGSTITAAFESINGNLQIADNALTIALIPTREAENAVASAENAVVTIFALVETTIANAENTVVDAENAVIDAKNTVVDAENAYIDADHKFLAMSPGTAKFNAFVNTLNLKHYLNNVEDDLVDAEAILIIAKRTVVNTLASIMVENAVIDAENAVIDAENDLVNVTPVNPAIIANHNLATAINNTITQAIIKINNGDKSARTDLLAKINPDVASMNTGNVVGQKIINSVINNRQEALVADSSRYGLSKYTGISTGDSTLDTGYWVKVSGYRSKMGMRGTVAGYKADSHGVTLGVDQKIMQENAVIGLAVSVIDTQVQGDSAGKSKTNTKQYQGTLYGMLFKDDYFLDGSLAYTHSKNHTSRISLDGEMSGDYNVYIYSATAGVGVPINRFDGLGIIPHLAMTYSFVDPKNYIETGSNILNLNVHPASMNLLDVEASVLANTKMNFNQGTITPKLRVAVNYDILQKQAQIVSSFVNTGVMLTPINAPKPTALGVTIGTGIDYISASEMYVLSLAYDVSKKSNFISHSANLMFRINF